MLEKTILLVLFSVAAILIFTYLQFTNMVNKEIKQLFSKNILDKKVVTEKMLENLPPPVQRYLHYSGVVGKPLINSVSLKQTGQIKTSPQGRWFPFTANEYYSVNPPGFIWQIKGPTKWMPILQGRDSYKDGNGQLLIKLFSLFTVAYSEGKELDQGAMMRYLNEMMWFPTAFLGENISWKEIDDTSAEVTLQDNGKTVSAVMYFDKEGKLVNFVAKRYRTVGENYRFDTWSTPLSDYKEFNGLNLPAKGKGVWNLENGDFEYIEIEIKDIQYEKIN